MTKRMTPQEIFEHSDFVKEADVPWQKLYAMVHGLLTETDEWRMLRTYNTLFLYNIQAEGTVSVTVIDAEKPEEFPKNLKEALKAFKKAGIKHIIYNAKGRYIQQLVKKLGYKVTDKVLSRDENGVVNFQGDIYV